MHASLSEVERDLILLRRRVLRDPLYEVPTRLLLLEHRSSVLLQGFGFNVFRLQLDLLWLIKHRI